MPDYVYVGIGFGLGWIVRSFVWPRIVEGYQSGRDYAMERLK